MKKKGGAFLHHPFTRPLCAKSAGGLILYIIVEINQRIRLLSARLPVDVYNIENRGERPLS